MKNNDSDILQNSKKRLMIIYGIILFIAYGFSKLTYNGWKNNLQIYHTILELFSVFIALAVFISVWYTYYRSSTSNRVLGFGYLAVAIVDALHAFYFLKLNLTKTSYFDLSTSYWILGRFGEAIIFFLFMQLSPTKKNKWAALCYTLGCALISNYFIVSYYELMPILLTEQGVTSVKTIIECVIIIFYILSLYKLKNKVNEKGKVTYRYIFMALLLKISSESCFVFYTSIESGLWSLGHILKIVSYYYLFKGTFISTINYPYYELEIKHQQVKKINEDLNIMGETLNSLLDSLPIAVQKYDFDGNLKYVNKKFKELLGFSRNTFPHLFEEENLNIFFNNKEDQKVFLNEILKEKKDIKNLIRTYKNEKGQNINFSISSKKMKDGILLLLRDIRTEQELESLHIQTDTILNALSNCILMVDKNRKIVVCNKSMGDIFEINKNEIIGMPIDELNRMVNFQSIELINLALEGGMYKDNYDISLISLSGNKKDLSMHLSTIKNVDQEIMGVIIICTDITEYKKEQQIMIQQEKLALLGQMGAGIVHETRNYLTTIKGRCQLIDMFAEDEKVKKYAAQMNYEVDEVNRIMTEFLFLSKPKEVEKTEVCLIDVIESIQTMVQATSLIKGVDVSFELSKEERYLLCDEAQLKQVILNICKNAVDAMIDRENPKIKIKSGYNECTNELFIKIEDNGKGIEEKDFKKIGTPFFTTKQNGTGLGLNVCYKIIKGHGGNIEVDSKLGVGTIFTVTLPCIEEVGEIEKWINLKNA